jgi:pimeloyl-ACP methyl ester carboxylesterase/DNA-binding winged helix-turn-helix (wHTH) protein
VTAPEAWWRAADFVEIASRAGQIGQRAPKGGRRRETVTVLWVFNGVEVDPDRFELLRDGEPVAVEPQVFDLLVYLIAHRDRVVTKAELLDNVWGDRFVSESALSSRIKAVRRAVGDDGVAQQVVRTVHGRGYRLVADVEERVRTRGRVVSGAARQVVNFCRASDGVGLAYAVSGDGPPLLKAANWLSHLEYDWESSIWRHWWESLSRSHRLIRYDERGCGLSDRDVEEYSMDAWVDDLATVADAAAVDEFDLLGISQGGAVAVSYAAAHPERVRRLVLYGAYTRGRRARAQTDEQVAEADLQIELARLGWGKDDPSFRRVFAMQFMPEGSYELWDEFAALQRRTTSSANAAHYMQSYSEIDITAVAPKVVAPTLVLHARDERRIPLEEGRRLAAAIPGSRFVTLDSPNHILLADEPAWPRFLEEVETFLADG